MQTNENLFFFIYLWYLQCVHMSEHKIEIPNKIFTVGLVLIAFPHYKQNSTTTYLPAYVIFCDFVNSSISTRFCLSDSFLSLKIHIQIVLYSHTKYIKSCSHITNRLNANACCQFLFFFGSQKPKLFNENDGFVCDSKVGMS